MLIGQRLREIRESKSLTLADLEKRSGLLRGYISRVERGRTSPLVNTLEKLARALGVPLYVLFREDGNLEDKAVLLPAQGAANELLWGNLSDELEQLRQFAEALAGMSDRQPNFLMAMAELMTK
jgi:transcriptional regulator with XRE-family HTH domain